MAKSSGSTRASSPQRGTEAGNGIDYYTEAQEQAIINIISNGGFVNFGDFSRIWTDIMDKDQRELMLMQAGFTGMTVDDELEESGTIYVPASKNDLVREIQEALVNEWEGYGMDDSTTFTIGYKDGTTVDVSRDFNEVDPVRPLTANQQVKTHYDIAKQSLKTRDIAWIIKTDGYDEPRYYVANGSKNSLREYGGFEFWNNGRGEKRREYIQDDWI